MTSLPLQRYTCRADIWINTDTLTTNDFSVKTNSWEKVCEAKRYLNSQWLNSNLCVCLVSERVMGTERDNPTAAGQAHSESLSTFPVLPSRIFTLTSGKKIWAINLLKRHDKPPLLLGVPSWDQRLELTFTLSLHGFDPWGPGGQQGCVLGLNTTCFHWKCAKMGNYR